MAFYYLPEDREREAKLHAKEMKELRDKRAQGKYPQDKTSVLVRQLRAAINGACPKHLSERQMIRRQFALFDKDESGVVDYKEFKLAIRKYMNGVEEEDILHIFQHFDRDNSKTLSVEEFTDLLLKEAGPHNYSYKEYEKSKPKPLTTQNNNNNAPSSRRTAKLQIGHDVYVEKQGNHTVKHLTSQRNFQLVKHRVPVKVPIMINRKI